MKVATLRVFAVAGGLIVVSAGGVALRSLAAPGRGISPSPTPKPAPAAKTKPRAYPPTSDYTVRNIEGWKVHIHKNLLAGSKTLGDKVLKLLEVKLYEINRVVAPEALACLHQIPIWVGETDHNNRFRCACHHSSAGWLRDNGYNPDKAGGVDILNAATFLDWTIAQPNMLLHELAHGYHKRFLPGGLGNKEIITAFDRAVRSKSYDSVLYFNGRKKRAYAMENPAEYFAELTEAHFGTNDFYPFVRAEARIHDPEMYKLLRKLWKEDRR